MKILKYRIEEQISTDANGKITKLYSAKYLKKGWFFLSWNYIYRPSNREVGGVEVRESLAGIQRVIDKHRADNSSPHVEVRELEEDGKPIQRDGW